MSLRRRLLGEAVTVAGHRGASATHPENTLSAITAAFDAGAHAVECDVRLTSDGVCVLMHDDTLQRTCGIDAAVAEVTAERLATLDAGSWFGAGFSDERVPTLAAALQAACGRGAVLVEVKEPFERTPDAAATVAAVAAAQGMLDEVAVLAFDHRHLAAAPPEVVRVALLRERPGGARALLRRTGADCLAPPWRHVDAVLCAEVRGAGGAVVTWTVNDAEAARTLVEAGVACVVGDDPAMLVGALSRPAR